MNEENNEKNINKTVLSKIESGEIKMKPKMFFVLKLILLILGTVIVILSALFIASFIFFTLKVSGVLMLPGFGFPGFRILFFSLPWLLIFGLIALIVTSELFVKHFHFVYKKPILYSVLVIILIVFLGGFFINNIGFHSSLFQKTKDGRFPLAEPFYREYGTPKVNGMHYGIVTQIEKNGFKIENPREEELLVSISQKTKMPKSEIKKNEAVIILGKRIGNIVHADNIRKADLDSDVFPTSPPPKKPF